MTLYLGYFILTSFNIFIYDEPLSIYVMSNFTCKKG